MRCFRERVMKGRTKKRRGPKLNVGMLHHLAVTRKVTGKESQ